MIAATAGVDSAAAWWRLSASVALMVIGASGMYVVVVVLPAVQAAREAELKRQEKEAERERAKQAKAYLLQARKLVEDALALAKGRSSANQDGSVCP